MKVEHYPTIITPFTPENQIDYASLGRLIDHLLKHHCDGIFAVCQSSEMFFLSDEEKLSLAAFCIDRCHIAGKNCVVSGHTHDALDEQIAYLQKLEKCAPDAIILVTNRLARENEGDDILIKNLQAIISLLDPGTRLGLYECPYPYKRLLSPEVIDYLVSTGRFDFIKDTSCQIEVIRARLRQTDGSTIRLYNANAATLLESLQAGAAGYSGIMLNFIPEIFSVFRRYLADDASGEIPPLQHHVRSAGAIADLITLTSVFECQKYPVNAKHYLKMKGLIDCTKTRSIAIDTLTESQSKELI
ncbi:MAG: dihydrodipicolinate synthase family protein, partial [Bacillota bacterium]|nr:dihydrodipicolinate synthase family protein [Bacillota bacterium]